MLLIDNIYNKCYQIYYKVYYKIFSIKNFKKKKRYKILCAVSIGFHIIGALFVLYSLIFDSNHFTSYLNNIRLITGLDIHNHRPKIILNTWMIAIQLRYVLTDTIAFINSLRNHNLLKYTIKIHGIESLICTFVFFLHYSKDCFVFGIVCLLWSIVWLVSYYFLIQYNKNN